MTLHERGHRGALKRNNRQVRTTVHFLRPYSSHIDLAQVLQEQGHRVVFEQKRPGGISAASEEILSIAIEAVRALFSIVQIVRDWLENRDEEEPKPNTVIIYGPDGQELRRVERSKK